MRSRNRRQRKLVVAAWSVVFAVTSLVAIGSALFVSIKHRRTHDSVVSETAQMQAPKEFRVTSRFPSPSEADALAIVKQGVLARDPATLDRFFRMNGVNASAAVMFLEGMARDDGTIIEYEWGGSMDQNGMLVDVVTVISQAGESVRKRIALLTPDENGSWKIDFHAFARTCEPEWSGITSGTSTGGKVRVLIQRDSYYNRSFSDDRTWVCYRLWSPDYEQSLLGYVKVNSPQSRALDRILRRTRAIGATKSVSKAFLSISRTQGAEARQFEITRVLAEGWVVSTIPFDEK